jgi:hypothetical protein
MRSRADIRGRKIEAILYIIALLLSGCSGQKEDGKKDRVSRIVDKEKGLPKPKKDDRTKTEPVSKDGPAPADPPATQRIEAATLSEEFRDEAARAKGKYHGKLLELSGVVDEIGVTATGDAYVVLQGVQNPVPRTIECIMSEKGPSSKLVRGQTVTLKGRCEYLGEELRFKECKLLQAK